MPVTRTAATSSTAVSATSLSPEPNGKELPERSRNAKAQARHREKRKAYIDHLEKSVASLKSQLANMGISPAVLPNAPVPDNSAVNAENEARLKALADENDRLKNEIRNLRATIDAMSTGRSSPSNNKYAAPGITPPATALLNTVPIPEDHHRKSPTENDFSRAGASALEGDASGDASSSSSPFHYQHQQHQLSVNIPRSPGPGLGISGIPQHLQGLYSQQQQQQRQASPSSVSTRFGKSPLSASHLTHHRHSLPSPSSSSSSASASTSHSPFTPSPFALEAGWSSNNFPRRDLPLPAGFGLSGGGAYDGSTSNVRGEFLPSLSSSSSYFSSETLPPSLAPPSSQYRASPRSLPVSPLYNTKQESSTGQVGGYDFGVMMDSAGGDGGWSTSSVRDVNVM